ncbi:MAG: 3-dehydroquinate synthase [Pseudomonadales bacterium]|nr:3-dehydroquinate synthase [Pseudomonadales bacterium]MDP6471803.1 3-dehydroquinate synthase [Pseudomonadales bacterium]MDP6828783.1 3-dehydroquinate synthase [Pseudomonadales bacterium]MDP6970284.1 3-dehydroquinate synthase [Pseudomonadales bacterium]
MNEVMVDLGERSYPIYIGAGLLERGDLLIRHIRGARVAIVTNETVASLYLETLRVSLGNIASDVFTMPDGEAHKNLATYTEIMDFLLSHRHERTTTLIALGGGVVGDITGFAAATYQRGVEFLQIPTTLLAQVDSSVGGKTAVNHPSGKNMIGAFYQPRCVIADMDVLGTLAKREYAAGLAEVVKYGMIWDAEFFEWLEGSAAALNAREGDALTYAVEASCRVKAQVVASDETERGLRAILNFGHTFGHALETVTRYERYLHGEAVAIGMVMAARASVAYGTLDDNAVERLKSLLASLGLPVTAQSVDREALREAMGMDKKVVGGRLRLVLSRDVGSVFVSDDFQSSIIDAVLTD